MSMSARRGTQRSRRRFVQGIAGGALLLGTGSLLGRTMAAAPKVLSGSQFDLSIDELAVNFTGAARVATAVNGQLPAPLLRWREGDTVTLRVTNGCGAQLDSLARHRSAGRHGRRAWPELPGIAPGETFVYRFPVNQNGTYWYHCHSRFQEQTGLYGRS